MQIRAVCIGSQLKLNELTCVEKLHMAHYTSISCCCYILGAYKVIFKLLLWNWFGCPGTWIDFLDVRNSVWPIDTLKFCWLYVSIFPKMSPDWYNTTNYSKININLRTLQTVSSRVLKEGRNRCRLGTGQEEGYLGWNMKKSVGFWEGGKERYMLSLLGKYF